MSKIYAKKPRQTEGFQQGDKAPVPQTGLPNSSMAERESSNHRGGDLGQQMAKRLPTVAVRPQAQIPQAEAEADRLSANVKASSAEGVKADLGRRMGADFSGIRFHTGADAAARANAAGARAFTSGADVYFGEGGFDPAVAAHELVHTVQQGMVSSSAPTMSTPTGGMQMLKIKAPLWYLGITKGKDGKYRLKDEDHVAYDTEQAARDAVKIKKLMDDPNSEKSKKKIHSKKFQDRIANAFITHETGVADQLEQSGVGANSVDGQKEMMRGNAGEIMNYTRMMGLMAGDKIDDITNATKDGEDAMLTEMGNAAQGEELNAYLTKGKEAWGKTNVTDAQRTENIMNMFALRGIAPQIAKKGGDPKAVTVNMMKTVNKSMSTNDTAEGTEGARNYLKSLSAGKKTTNETMNLEDYGDLTDMEQMTEGQRNKYIRDKFKQEMIKNKGLDPSEQSNHWRDEWHALKHRQEVKAVDEARRQKGKK